MKKQQSFWQLKKVAKEELKEGAHCQRSTLRGIMLANQIWNPAVKKEMPQNASWVLLQIIYFYWR